MMHLQTMPSCFYSSFHSSSLFPPFLFWFFFFSLLSLSLSCVVSLFFSLFFFFSPLCFFLLLPPVCVLFLSFSPPAMTTQLAFYRGLSGSLLAHLFLPERRINLAECQYLIGSRILGVLPLQGYWWWLSSRLQWSLVGDDMGKR